MKSATRRVARQEGKIKWKLSEFIIGALSREQKELIGEFKVVVGDVISIWG